jgi:ABC-type spermidine/putrescine transport system permease subunit II
VFLFAPVVLVVLFSFNSVSSTSPPIHGLSLRWYKQLFGEADFSFALKNSLIAATSTMAVVLITGTIAALALSRRRSRLLDALSTLVVAPLVVPGLFLGVALYSYFNEIGMQFSLITVVIGHCLVTLPFVVLIVNARLANTDRAMVEAARDLGASGWKAFWKVLFPAIVPAIVGAGLLVVAWSLDEFIITLWTNGGQITLPVFIFEHLRLGITPAINAIASLVLGCTVIAAAVATRFLSPGEIAG